MPKSSLDNRLKKIRKELSLIDKDLRTLSDAASDPASMPEKPRLRSKEMREKEVARTVVSDAESRRQNQQERPVQQKRQKAKRESVLTPKGVDSSPHEERFLEYLSSSFNSGRPLGQERKIQRNKAVLMIVIVLLILFLVLYKIFV